MCLAVACPACYSLALSYKMHYINTSTTFTDWAQLFPLKTTVNLVQFVDFLTNKEVNREEAIEVS